VLTTPWDTGDEPVPDEEIRNRLYRVVAEGQPGTPDHPPGPLPVAGPGIGSDAGPDTGLGVGPDAGPDTGSDAGLAAGLDAGHAEPDGRPGADRSAARRTGPGDRPVLRPPRAPARAWTAPPARATDTGVGLRDRVRGPVADPAGAAWDAEPGPVGGDAWGGHAWDGDGRGGAAWDGDAWDGDGRDGRRTGGDGRFAARAARRLGAFDPGRRGLRALGIVAALVAVGAALVAWHWRDRAEPVIPAGAGVTVLATPSASGTPVVVAVAGRVRRPGLVRLPPGSRVADAVAAAGGALPGTDLGRLNLARRLVDGELVSVGVDAAAPTGAAGGLLDLNTATQSELDALPGVGPTLAERIIGYRTAHGGFQSVEQLRQVDGIGPATFAKIRDRVTV
jgi:competence protein ComEA